MIRHRKQMTDIAAITTLIEPEAQALGFDLVRVAMFGGKSDPTLQVMAERRDTRQLDLTDCEALSRRISDLLDTADLIADTYRLEVSSPGIDRPLTRLQDFRDWAGFDARIRLAEAQDGRKQFDARIAAVDGHAIRFVPARGDALDVPFAAIAAAKLLLTDALLKATAPIDASGADRIMKEE